MTALRLSNQIMPWRDEREGRQRERRRHTAQSQIPLLVTEWVPSLRLPLLSISSDYADRLPSVLA